MFSFKTEDEKIDSIAWKKLVEYIDQIALNEEEEFFPSKILGQEMFEQIHTLPETISKLVSVKRVLLYGSKLKAIPSEIGEMKALEYLDLYTSYDLHWLPFEITHCNNLKQTKFSTRALYGNYKNRMPFPDLTKSAEGDTKDSVKCSVCKKDIPGSKLKQVWISLLSGTDVLPLLTNLCSIECESALPGAPEGYVRTTHQGGANLIQPSYKEWEKANVVNFTLDDLEQLNSKEDN